ncbi:hypothetical protein [Roseivirga echinicomitans]|uniref:Uncharacterized protein n=1 Tax=Roseivirga echinicomitans TaxID=296218 RepID=A0A150WZP8_9BACT|nr:hypothetical protein [Roseivirga echinicomitans]KYG71955.1 hypothetical protein AWN68_12295 [Roseivirga echinicomitans]
MSSKKEGYEITQGLNQSTVAGSQIYLPLAEPATTIHQRLSPWDNKAYLQHLCFSPFLGSLGVRVGKQADATEMVKTITPLANGS